LIEGPHYGIHRCENDIYHKVTLNVYHYSKCKFKGFEWIRSSASLQSNDVVCTFLVGYECVKSGTVMFMPAFILYWSILNAIV